MHHAPKIVRKYVRFSNTIRSSVWYEPVVQMTVRFLLYRKMLCIEFASYGILRCFTHHGHNTRYWQMYCGDYTRNSERLLSQWQRKKKMIFCMKNSNQFDKLALKYFDRIHYSIDRDCVEHRITAQLHSWHSRPVKCQIESIDWHRDCWCYSPAATRLSRTRQRSGVSFEIYLWHKHQTSLPRLRIPNTNRHSIQS